MALGAAVAAAQEAQGQCPRIVPLSPIRERPDLGALLRQRGLTGDAAELGVQNGLFTGTVLRGWRHAGRYVQVDAWRDLGGGANATTTAGGSGGEENRDVDKARVGAAEHAARRGRAERVLAAAVDLGYASAGEQCADTTLACAGRYADGAFDFVYVDAGHSRREVLADLAAWWPKVRAGGVMAGHDYTEQREPAGHAWAHAPPDVRAEPFAHTAQHFTVEVAGRGDQVISTRPGESRAAAAARFAEEFPNLAGAGCGDGDVACVARTLANAPGWQSYAE